MKRVHAGFICFVHACLGHRTLARAIIQFGITSREQLIKALYHADRFRSQAFLQHRGLGRLGMSNPGSKFASDTTGADEAMSRMQPMSSKTHRARNTHKTRGTGLRIWLAMIFSKRKGSVCYQNASGHSRGCSHENKANVATFPKQYCFGVRIFPQEIADILVNRCRIPGLCVSPCLLS